MRPKMTTGVPRESAVVRTDVMETPAQPRSRNAVKIDREQSAHLVTMFSAPSGLVGVCLTAIGLVGIIKSLTQKEMPADDLLAVASLVFVIGAQQNPMTRLKQPQDSTSAEPAAVSD